MPGTTSVKWLYRAALVAALGAVALLVVAQRDRQGQSAPPPRAQSLVELAQSDVAPLQPHELTRGLAISGALKAVNSAMIKARVAGELDALMLREGDFVRAGQVVAKVDATEFQARVQQAQQQAQAAKAQVDIARRAFENNRSLVAQGFISSTALESSQAGLAAAEASYQAAQAGAEVALKSLQDTVLRSPISGQVAQRLAQNGERVGIDARVLEIVDLSRLELEASLSPSDALDVKVGQTARLEIEGGAKSVLATVARINPATVAGSRAVLVYLAVEPTPGLRQGLFVQAFLGTQRVRGLAVPLAAVRTDKPSPYLQTVGSEHVLHQSVELGPRGESNGETMVIVKGVAENTAVIGGSVGSLRAGSPVKFTKAPK